MEGHQWWQTTLEVEFYGRDADDERPYPPNLRHGRGHQRKADTLSLQGENRDAIDQLRSFTDVL